jgi:DNA-binding NarL/FixJ family response regulator
MMQSSAQQGDNGRQEAAATQAPHRPAVVLVDDHEIVLDGLSRALAREGMHVAGTFMDSAPAMDFLHTYSPHGHRPPVQLVVADLRLGHNSSIAFIRDVCRTYPHTRVAVLTSFEDSVAAAAAVRAGARGFLLKDMPSGELSKSLRSIAEGNLVIDARMAPAVLAPEQHTLSEGELAVLQLVAEGLTNREIGARLHLSASAVKDQLAKSMRKLGTNTRTETVVRAVQEGMLSNPMASTANKTVHAP